MNNLGCVFCHQQEKYNRPHDKEVSSFCCSICVQKLLVMSQGQLQQAYNLAVEKGCPEKASLLEQLIEEEEHVQETGKTRPNLVRERPMRKAQFARY